MLKNRFKNKQKSTSQSMAEENKVEMNDTFIMIDKVFLLLIKVTKRSIF
jgi:hypothetical protein